MQQFLDLILDGKYLMATGAAFVMIVAILRSGLIALKVPWFGTKIGGYVLAYVTSFALYLSTSFSAGDAPTAKLLLTAFMTAVMSSGILDHWRDIFSAARKEQDKTGTPEIKEKATEDMTIETPTPRSSRFSLIPIMALILVSCTDCNGTTPTPNSVLTSVVDCASPSGDILSRIESEAVKIGSIVFGSDLDKWNKAEVVAINDGLTIGGCALAQVVNDWITKKSLSTTSAVAEVHDAKTMFESYRTKYAGGATFKTKKGDM